MIASELRVGNLVSKSHGKTWKVQGYDIAEFKSDWKIIRPMPITQAWVEMAGFELYLIDPAEDGCAEIRSYRRWANEKKRIYYAVSFSGDLIQFLIHRNERDHFVLRNVAYVHELQNLFFSLTGQEILR